jgi:hypothetical protein
VPSAAKPTLTWPSLNPLPDFPNYRSVSHRHHPRLALPKSSKLTTTSSQTPPGLDSLPSGTSGPAKNYMGKKTQFSPERAPDRSCRPLTLSCGHRSVLTARPSILASNMPPSTGSSGIVLVKPHPRTLIGRTPLWNVAGNVSVNSSTSSLADLSATPTPYSVSHI